MSQFSTYAGFAALLLLTTACSQPPALVELKGQNTYGRNSYALNAPAPLYSYASPAATAPTPAYRTTANTVTQSASIQPIGVHELSSLSPAAGVAPKPVVLSSVPESSSPPVNPWTHKPHFTAAENAPDSPSPSQSKPIAQLDRIIGSDSAKATPASIVEKPVKAETVAFMWPVSGKRVISGFGPKGGGKTNDGINIAAGEGEPVWASADGEIVYVGNELAGYGNMVLIKHTGNKTTAYAHLSRAIVDKYDRVKQGDIIGYVGATGNVKESQLHFAIRDGKDPVDPAKYLSRSVASN